ncbi:MAG TPA: hypothetical protein PK671_12690, partial [Candidatus Obscuribacter sp.]|nr:hypothetical protein [Candidatus Obscuribacter sp.]
RDRCTELVSDQMKLYNHFRERKKWSEALNIQLSIGEIYRYCGELRASAQYREYANHYLEIADEADTETIKELWNRWTQHIFNHFGVKYEEEPALAVAKQVSAKIYDRLFAEIDSAIEKDKYKEAMDSLNDTAKLANTGWTHIYVSARKHGLIPTEKIAARMKSIRDKVDPLDAALIDYWIEFYKF